MKNQKFQLNKRLAGYSATAVALAAFTANAEGQVVYSGLKNIVVKMTNDTIDIDGNGVEDFAIKNFHSLFYNFAKIANLHSGNGWLGSGDVYALNSGYYFQPAYNFFGGNGILGSASGGNHWGYFPDQGDRFIGVKFLIGTDAHLGWIRVNIPATIDSVTVIDWAYQKNTGIGISTGDTAAPVLSGVSVDKIGKDTAVFNITSSGLGQLYYGVKKSTDPAPSFDDLHTGTGFVTSNMEIISAGNHNNFVINELSPNNTYTIYACEFDFSGDTSELSSLTFMTADTIPPIISGISVINIHPTTAIAHLTSNENGKVYFAVKLGTDPAPTATQVKSGTGFVASGNADVNAATPHAFNITGLNAAIAYKVYMIAEDASNNLSAITHVDFSTISNVGVSDIANNNITISPNPAANVLYISMPEKSEYAIVDAVGQLIQTGKLEAGKSQVNISRLSQGIYIIHINFNNGTTFVKQIMKK